MGRRHNIEVKRYGTSWRAECSCRATGRPAASESVAEEWVYAHLHTVERAKAHLRGQPTLASTYAYYREMEADPAVSDGERAQWKMLADGLEHRLGVTAQTDSMF